MTTENMELENTYENPKELVERQSGRAGGKRETLNPDALTVQEPISPVLNKPKDCLPQPSVAITSTDGLCLEFHLQPMELAQRNLSLKVIYVLLGVCMLLSVVAVITAVMLTIKISMQTPSSVANIQDEISQLSKNTTASIASVINELSQWKNDVAVKFRDTNSSISKLQGDILQWNNNRLRCPTEWNQFRESCYQFYSNSDTWVKAQRRCASADSHLVVINNAAEKDYIRQYVNKNYWIGLNDIIEEGIWRWVDGTDYPSSVQFWGPSQPNGRAEYDEDCVVVAGDGLWHDWPCDSMHFAICEKRAI